MTAGELRERVRFDRRVSSLDDGYGNTQTTWLPVVTLSARIDPMSGGEQVLSSKLSGIELVEITVRWCNASKSIKVSDRAVDVRSGNVFNIRSAANDDEKRQWMCFVCSLGDAYG